MLALPIAEVSGFATMLPVAQVALIVMGGLVMIAFILKL